MVSSAELVDGWIWLPRRAARPWGSPLDRRESERGATRDAEVSRRSDRSCVADMQAAQSWHYRSDGVFLEASSDLPFTRRKVLRCKGERSSHSLDALDF